jgi:hypothetical protein
VETLRSERILRRRGKEEIREDDFRLKIFD